MWCCDRCEMCIVTTSRPFASASLRAILRGMNSFVGRFCNAINRTSSDDVFRFFEMIFEKQSGRACASRRRATSSVDSSTRSRVRLVRGTGHGYAEVRTRSVAIQVPSRREVLPRCSVATPWAARYLMALTVHRPSASWITSGTWLDVETVASIVENRNGCLLYTSPSPRDGLLSRMPSSA